MMKISSSKALSLIILIDGLLWLRSSWGKLAGGTFVNSLGETLTKFASKNPYPWFKNILTSFSIPNSIVIGNLVMWGEFLSAVSLVLASLIYLIKGKLNKGVKLILIFGLVVSSLLSLNFWLAAGWTSASTDGLNLLMVAVQIITLLTIIIP